MSKQTTALSSGPDEMEIAVSYQAMRITWTIVNVVFVGAAIVFLANGGAGGINPISLVLLVAAEIVFFVVKSLLTWKMTRGGVDKE